MSKITPEKKKEIEDRVAAKKAEWADRKKKYKGKAIKLSEEILQGIAYEELAYVKLFDGTIGEVTIRPLAEGEMMSVLAQIGMDKLDNFGSGDFTEEDYDFFWTIVSVSTGLKKESIKKTFAVGESAIIANRIMDISGFSEDVEGEVEDF